MGKQLLPLNTLNVPPKKIAIVFGSGGLVGGFEVGAFAPIEENRLPFDKVYGSSVGAINGGSIVSRNGSSKELRQAWLSFRKPSQIFEYQNALYFIATLGMPESIYKIEPLIKLVAMIDADELVAQEREFVATTTNVPSGKVVYFSNKDPEIIARPIVMSLAILASCAFPSGFPAIPIFYKGKWGEYIDGVFKRPMPLIKTLRDGYDTVIAIRCRSDKTRGKYPRDWAHAVAYGLELKHNLEEKDEIERVRREYENGINLFVIEPEFLPPTLTTVSFDKGDIQESIMEGNRISLVVLAPLIEYYKSHPI